MLVVIKSPPGTEGATSGLRLARDMAADVLLLEDGVLLAGKDRLEGFCGTAHALGEDLDKRDVGPLEKGVRVMDRVELEELLGAEEIIGEF